MMEIEKMKKNEREREGYISEVKEEMREECCFLFLLFEH